MKRYVENLRQKSEAEKNRVAFWGSFAITGIIVLFWLMAVTYDGRADEKKFQVANPTNAIKEIEQQFVDGYIDNSR